MKKRNVGFIVAAALLALSGFTACAGTPETEKTQATPVPTEEPALTPTEEPEVTQGLSRPLSEGLNPLECGKVLTGLSVVGEDSPYYCNLEENMLQGYDRKLLLCPDPVYGITYYVNYGGDYFIYALRDGAAEPAVEAPARELYCRNGELYFILDSYGLYELSEAEQGNILKYNPVDGSVEIVIGEPAADMVVYPDCILYETHEELDINDVDPSLFPGGKVMGYYMAHIFRYAEGKTRELEKGEQSAGTRMARWKEYRLMKGTDGVYLEDSEGKFVRNLENLDTLPKYFLIKGDVMYYIEWLKSDVRHVRLVNYQMETGEITKMDLGDGVYEYEGFLIQDEIVHFGSHLTLFLKDGTQASTFVEGQMGVPYELHGFFTDGKELYGVVGGKLCRMTLDKIGDGVVKQLGYGVDVVMQGYEYRRLPIEKKED